MRTPEQQTHPRGGRKMEADLNMHYLSPGAFTVLPLDVERLPDPPPAPPPYRLPVNSKRYKHAAFAIVGEATPSNPNSRSSSPTGRVSPFRGHGFNPSSSRRVSPSSSPVPPADPQKLPRHPSKIPKPNVAGKPRKASTEALFGEKVLNRQASRSMTNLEVNNKETRSRPPPSPRKKLKGAIKQLSPIQGSSPEPSQSSPGRIPGAKSRSTPPSRFTSPSRQPVKVPSRSRSRPNIVTSPERVAAMNSPSKTPRHNKYSHVKARIDSHQHLPLKSTKNESSDLSEDSDRSPKKVKAPSRKNSLNRANVLKNYTSDSSVTNSDTTNRSKVAKKPTPAVSPSRTKSPPKKEPVQSPKKQNTKQSDEAPSSSPPSALDVVSSTTDAVTKPLKIETPKLPRTKPVSPIIDGRMLSSTSVSQAINKMNDTVLNTQTLIKDSGLGTRFPQPTPDPPAVISAKNRKTEEEQVNIKTSPAEVPKEDGKTVDKLPTTVKTVDEPPTTLKTTKNTPPTEKKDTVQDKPTAPQPLNKTPSPKKEPLPPPIATNNNHTNHVTTVGLGNAKALEREVQNNMGRLLGSLDSSLGDTPLHKMSVNDRIKEARTVIAADVKPIQIHVREKPSEVEVQSGNVGPHFGVANGVNNERPSISLPPSQQQQQQRNSPPEEPPKEEVTGSRCKRFLSTCAGCLGGKCCRKQEGDEKVGCCQSLKNKFSRQPKEQVRINIEDEDGAEPKRGLWQKLNCCNKNKVGDSRGCFSLRKSWPAKRDNERVVQSQEEEKPKCCSKPGCKSFFATIFCCYCCRKKPELPPSASTRKESMVSNKKKSLTPLSVPPPEDKKPKIDSSLVEHNSHMKAAIPVLPIWLAWFCCVMNCIGPGTGTVLSGMFCLCIGKPRFSQNDGPKPRIGAFIIDLIIGFSQFFTVLFCLVGWGWSIWWGVIMVKIAKKHKKLKHLEKLEDAAGKPHSLAGQPKRDAERGRT